MSHGTSTMFGFPVRGLTGEESLGGCEWAVDAFIIPFFAHTCPAKARALLQFRIHTLYQAKATAREADLPRGALYALRMPPRAGHPFPAYFPFQNAVIAYAMRQFVLASGDRSILTQGGAEVVLASALVWLEWGVWERGGFHLRGVLGADCYGGIQHDHLFTNLIAREQLRWVGEIARELRAARPELWRDLLDRCEATEDDIAAMERAAAKMVIVYDAENRIHPVDHTFPTKNRWTLSDLTLRDDRGPLIERFHPYLIYRHQVCHIPDVLLAMMLLPDCFSAEEMRADFDFYEAITAPDSYLQGFIKGVLAARLRLGEKAMGYFRQALLLDLDDAMGDTEGGLHCANMAGAWWVLAMGFAGAKITPEALHVDPELPAGCQGYAIHLRHAGGLVRVDVRPRIATYTLLEAPAGTSGLCLLHGGHRHVHLTTAEPQKVRLGRELCVFDFDCVVFEVDSILVGIQDVHYAAWKGALEEYFAEIAMPEFVLTKELFLAYLRHNRPMNGLAELFKRFNRPFALPSGQTSSEKGTIFSHLFSRKLQKFRQIIQEQTLQLREGAIPLLTNLRASGIMVGAVTDSKNGRWIINELPQLQALFDHFIDGVDGENLGWCYRPEMDYFRCCAKSMDCACSRAVIVMDSSDGYSKSCVEQFCMVIDVSVNQEAQQFRIPCVNINDFSDLTTELINEYISNETLQNYRRSRRIVKP
ncbi:unnamed protein product [Phytomonas sp. Hart1]|nr:unnamed protein product [Phytomonas sp. Hart1]|eukprot:CCW69944.1 unnamed protein product [Phytomonas sp. isolate Hart1]